AVEAVLCLPQIPNKTRVAGAGDRSAEPDARKRRRGAVRRTWWVGCLGAAVLLTGRAVAADDLKKPARAPELWAIVVGVGDYEDQAIPKSETAAREADAL